MEVIMCDKEDQLLVINDMTLEELLSFCNIPKNRAEEYDRPMLIELAKNKLE